VERRELGGSWLLFCGFRWDWFIVVVLPAKFIVRLRGGCIMGSASHAAEYKTIQQTLKYDLAFLFVFIDL
jgi:hypothetical protein